MKVLIISLRQNGLTLVFDPNPPCTILKHDKQYHMNVLLNSIAFDLNGHTLGFYSQT